MSRSTAMWKTFCMSAAVAACSLLLANAAHAGLSITNGNMENGAPPDTDSASDNQADVVDWYDGNGGGTQTDAAWWTSTWYGTWVSPNGTSVMGLSAEASTDGDHWAYQSIGVNDGGLDTLSVAFDVGSFTDAGGDRDIGVIVGVYQSDGSFAPAEGTDIDGAAGITLIGSESLTSGVLPAGGEVSRTANIDISSANMVDELFLRFTNFNAGTGGHWGSIDNVTIVPEPATLGLLALSGLLTLNGRRRRR